MSTDFIVIRDNLLKAAGNPYRDALTGQFSYGPGNRTRDREDSRERTERRENRQEQGERRQPSSGQVILAEQQARQQGETVNANFDVHSAEQMQMASRETGGSRVFNFSQGEGSDLDRNVKFVTNTNSDGTFERGALRVEIFDPDTQKRHVYQRQMSELPALVRQVIQKRYSVIGQHRRNTSHFVKADSAGGHWATVPGGQRVFIRNSGASQNQQPQAQAQQPQAKPARTVEAQENQGEGLSHSQRVTIATKIAAKLGIDPAKIQVSETDESDENGTKAGEYSPDTGMITVFPASFVNKQELVGTLSHEAAHANLSKVLGMYNAQRKLFEGGESLQSDKVEVYRELKPVFAENGRATYASADGINNYSTLFWNRYSQNQTTQTYTAAVSETLAEISRLTQVGEMKEIHPQWRRLYNNVNKFAGGGQ